MHSFNNDYRLSFIDNCLLIIVYRLSIISAKNAVSVTPPYGSHFCKRDPKRGCFLARLAKKTQISRDASGFDPSISLFDDSAQLSAGEDEAGNSGVEAHGEDGNAEASFGGDGHEFIGGIGLVGANKAIEFRREGRDKRIERIVINKHPILTDEQE